MTEERNEENNFGHFLILFFHMYLTEYFSPHLIILLTIFAAPVIVSIDNRILLTGEHTVELDAYLILSYN